jgi:hypothetical protein
LSPSRPQITVLTNYTGSFQLEGMAGLDVKDMAAGKLPGTELEPPPLLFKTPPGEVVVVDDVGEPSSPLILAAHGRYADLIPERNQIEAALGAGRPVEIRVFDSLPEG